MWETVEHALVENKDLRKVIVIGEKTPPKAISYVDFLLPAKTKKAIFALDDECAFWLYSSGSTGQPKGVRHVHSALLATAETYGAQVGYKFKLDKNTKVTVGLGYYNIPLSGSELADVLADEFGNTASGTTYAYDYEIQQVFAEVKTKILGQKSTFYADYIKNDGDSNIDGISDPKEDSGFVYGVKVGNAKKRGDLAFGYAYQDLEQDATFGAHTDSDFGGGGTDTKGSKISGALGLSKNTSLALTYFDTEYGKESRGEEFDYERLQVDLKTKF